MLPMRARERTARSASQTDWDPTARADPQAFLAVLERIKQAAGSIVAGDEL